MIMLKYNVNDVGIKHINNNKKREFKGNQIIMLLVM